MYVSSHFARAFFYARQTKNLTQSQVAEMAGISVRWYQKLERGDARPSFEVCVQVAAALDIDLNALAKGIQQDDNVFSFC